MANNKFEILKNRKVVLFEEGDCCEPDLTPTFIQIYVNNLPYFRVSHNKPWITLEKFLREFNISFERDFSSNVPLVDGNNYKLVGVGEIFEVHSLDKKTRDFRDKYLVQESSHDNNIYIGGQWDYIYKGYDLKPNAKHFLEIIDYFSKDLVFLVDDLFSENVLPEEDGLPF